MAAKQLKERKERNKNKKEELSIAGNPSSQNADGDGDDENEDDKGDDEDYELRLIREQRLKQIKNAHTQKIENIAKGHGWNVLMSFLLYCFHIRNISI